MESTKHKRESSVDTMFVLALSGVNAAVATSFPNYLSPVLSLCLFLAIVALTFYKRLGFAITATPLILFFFTELLSGIFVEFGAFLSETNAYGSLTGAFSRLSFLYVLCFVLGEQMWRKLEGKSKGDLKSVTTILAAPRLQSMLMYLMLSLWAILFVYVAFRGSAAGFALLVGQDRFAFRAEINDPLVITFLDNNAIWFTLFGYAISRGVATRLMVFLIICQYTLLILVGDKFTSIVLGLLYIVSPIVICRYYRGQSIYFKQIFAAALGIFILTIPLTLLNYGGLSSMDTAVERFSNRIAQQGQLWFLADRDFLASSVFDTGSTSAAFKSLFVLGEQSATAAGTKHGMYYVIREFTDSERLYWTQFAGGAFVFAHAPYWLMVSGVFGCVVVSIVTFCWYTFVAFKLSEAFRNFDTLSLLIWIKVIAWILAGYTLGNFWFFFGLETQFLVLCAVIWELGFKRMQRPIRNNGSRSLT